jgi:hypothetical protein
VAGRVSERCCLALYGMKVTVSLASVKWYSIKLTAVLIKLFRILHDTGYATVLPGPFSLNLIATI